MHAMLALKNIASQLPGRKALLKEDWMTVVCNAIDRVKYDEKEQVIRDEQGIRKVLSGVACYVYFFCDPIMLRLKSEFLCNARQTLRRLVAM